MHPRWKVTMERYQEVMVGLSEAVMKNRMKRPLAEKSPWRHIRLAIKPRYLGNHAFQIKSYHWTLSGSHGRSFGIRHEKSLCYWVKWNKYICCFMRATHAINNIYKLISFWIYTAITTHVDQTVARYFRQVCLIKTCIVFKFLPYQSWTVLSIKCWLL